MNPYILNVTQQHSAGAWATRGEWWHPKRALNKEANTNKKGIINLMVMAKAQIQFYIR